MPASGDLGAGGTSESSDSRVGEAGKRAGCAESMSAAKRQTHPGRPRQQQISFEALKIYIFLPCISHGKICTNILY